MAGAQASAGLGTAHVHAIMDSTVVLHLCPIGKYRPSTYQLGSVQQIRYGCAEASPTHVNFNPAVGSGKLSSGLGCPRPGGIRERQPCGRGVDPEDGGSQGWSSYTAFTG